MHAVRLPPGHPEGAGPGAGPGPGVGVTGAGAGGVGAGGGVGGVGTAGFKVVPMSPILISEKVAWYGPAVSVVES